MFIHGDMKSITFRPLYHIIVLNKIIAYNCVKRKDRREV